MDPSDDAVRDAYRDRGGLYEVGSASFHSVWEEHQLEIVFETFSLAEQLVDWIVFISHCFGYLVYPPQVRVGVVCQDREGCILAEHWWP